MSNLTFDTFLFSNLWLDNLLETVHSRRELKQNKTKQNYQNNSAFKAIIFQKKILSDL